MEDILLSIIIPAHNASATLKRLIESLQIEKAAKIEVLIVENGSQDNTLKTAEQLAKQFPCIKVIQSEKGVSVARNEGLRQARGKWIAFADADDWFLPGAVSVLLKQTNADLTLFCYEVGQNQKQVAVPGGKWFRGKDCQLARVRMLENPTLYMQVWSKLFSGDIIRKHGLQFDTRLAFSEDSDFTFRYSKYCSSIFFSDKRIYHYDLNVSSVMRAFDGKKAEQYLRAMLVSSKVAKGESEKIQNAFTKYVLMHMNIVMVREVFVKANTMSFFEKKKLMKQLLFKEPFTAALQRVNLSDCRSGRMLPILMLKLKCYTVAALVFQAKATVNARLENKARNHENG